MWTAPPLTSSWPFLPPNGTLRWMGSHAPTSRDCWLYRSIILAFTFALGVSSRRGLVSESFPHPCQMWKTGGCPTKAEPLDSQKCTWGPLASLLASGPCAGSVWGKVVEVASAPPTHRAGRGGRKHILPVTFQPGSGGSELVLPATSSSPCPSVHCSVTRPCEWGFGGTAPFLRGRLEASPADLQSSTEAPRLWSRDRAASPVPCPLADYSPPSLLGV